MNNYKMKAKFTFTESLQKFDHDYMIHVDKKIHLEKEKRRCE